MKEKRTNAAISPSKTTSSHPNVKCPRRARIVPVSPVRPSPSPRTNAIASHGSVRRGNRNRYATAPSATIWIVARMAAGNAGRGNAGHVQRPNAEGRARNRSTYRQFHESAAAAASPNIKVTSAKNPRPHARSSLVFGAVTSSTRTASSWRGSGTAGSIAGGGGVIVAGGGGGSKAIAEVSTGAATGSAAGELSSGLGLVRVSVSGTRDSATMAAHRLLRRWINRMTIRRAANSTPTAIPMDATDVRDQGEPAGASRPCTSTTHWKSVVADPSDTTTLTTKVPVSFRTNSNEGEDPPTAIPSTVHVYVSGSPSGSNAPTWSVVDSDALTTSESWGLVDSTMGARFPTSIVIVA